MVVEDETPMVVDSSFFSSPVGRGLLRPPLVLGLWKSPKKERPEGVRLRRVGVLLGGIPGKLPEFGADG